MGAMISERKSARREQILGAALGCFMQYGYAKTACDDVAKAAGVSRSLLYAYFADKKDLFISLVNDMLDRQLAKTRDIFAAKASREEKFLGFLELWGVELYSHVADSPHGNELFDEGNRAWEETGRRHREALVRLLAGLVGGSDRAELIMLSLKGLQADRPSVPVLRKRMRLLAELGWHKRGQA